MTHLLPSRRALFIALAVTALTLTLGVTGAAHAAPGPGDDRLLSVPTDWWMFNNISPDDLTDRINDHHARITDLRVTSASPLRFSAVLVKNSGAYASGWWWYYGVTLDEIHDLADANQARPITLQPYVVGSVTRYAVVMVSNTGANHRQWSLAVGSQDFVVGALPDGWRAMTLATFINPSGDRHYASIFVPNRENFGWWWYFRVSVDFIRDTQHGECTGVMDVSADDNEAMQLNVLLYQPLYGPHGVCQNGTWYDTNFADLRTELQPFDRPLLVDQFTLHGTGTADGETQFISIVRDNY